MVTLYTLNACKTLLTHPTGELMYLSAFGQGVLVINSQRVAVDLLEKRSHVYSDRPRYISAGDFLTENLTFVFTGYNDLYVVPYRLIVLLPF